MPHTHTHTRKSIAQYVEETRSFCYTMSSKNPVNANGTSVRDQITKNEPDEKFLRLTGKQPNKVLARQMCKGEQMDLTNPDPNEKDESVVYVS